MARKDNSRNPLQLRIEAVSVPKSVRPETYVQRLMDTITEGRELPSQWDVRLHWRNPGVKHGLTRRWRVDSFEDAVRESRSGFNSILLWTLESMMHKVQMRRAMEKRKR